MNESICVYVLMHMCMYMCMYVCMYVICRYVCMQVRMYVRMNVRLSVLHFNVVFSSFRPLGMQHEGLFSRAISGTKMIVEQYHESVAYALDFICDSQVRTRLAVYVLLILFVLLCRIV